MDEERGQLEVLRARISAIHYEVDGSPYSEGSCIEDGQDYPCATLRALDPEVQR